MQRPNSSTPLETSLEEGPEAEEEGSTSLVVIDFVMTEPKPPSLLELINFSLMIVGATPKRVAENCAFLTDNSALTVSTHFGPISSVTLKSN